MLYSDAPYAAAIDHVLDKFAPYDLAAAIREYRFNKDTQYAIQASVRKLQEKEMRYTERAVDLLSTLENANALGRIFAHEMDITQYCLDHLTPDAYFEYCKQRQDFMGEVTRSALDTRVIKRAKPSRIISLPHDATRRYAKRAHARYNALDAEEEHIRRGLHCPPAPKRLRRDNVPLHIHARKQCHRCMEWGHIRATCPTRPGVAGLRK
jgi:hypothetical protein